MNKTKKPKIKTAVYLAGSSKKSARALEHAVMKVLNCSAGDDVKKEALRVIATTLTTNAYISGCTFDM
jgi:hypothetical protein